jgi:hypothetical protein
VVTVATELSTRSSLFVCSAVGVALEQ